MAVVCCIFAAPVYSFASDGMQPFIVASDLYGSSNFAMSNGDGTLGEQESIVRFDSTTNEWSYSSGVGDFNNDGVLDVVLAVGYEAGIIFLYGKIENNQFVEQNSDTQWSRGRYPGRMAVADFDEDGNLDFIMTYDGSIDCDLYKGNGNFEFTPIELPDTAPQISIAADVGDFDGDGHADFVVGSYSPGSQTYINYGDGLGGFTRKEIIYPMYAYYGYTSVAAGDFNGDGLDDFAISTSIAYIYIYLNDPNYGFTYAGYIVDGNFYTSPIDAHDMDGNGTQDLVIGGYKIDGAPIGIAVMLGNGDGTFSFHPDKPSVFGGDTAGLDLITCVSAPTPFQPPPVNPNIPPVAEISCDTSEVTAGDTVIVDGQFSEDEDGDIVSYLWDFGDGTTAEGLMAEHVYYDVGEYTITLTVTDDQDESDTDEFIVNVSPVSARVRIFPRVLNLKSRRGVMHAWVKLPDSCDATQVSVDSIEIVDGGSSQPISFDNSRYGVSVRTRQWLARHNRFYLRFDRQATIEAITNPSSQAMIQIYGQALCNGDYVEFEGDDRIRIIDPKKKKKKSWRGWKRRWRRGGCRNR